ncbi:hypothetical protein ACQEVF_57760 [Nonomuraea polychroma]|uniref:TubC N-terminal docking domain-related protein n=1 Tax=Nonomuraea polychroma TaxID=46176 RepID=UPI003D8D21AD
MTPDGVKYEVTRPDGLGVPVRLPQKVVGTGRHNYITAIRRLASLAAIDPERPPLHEWAVAELVEHARSQGVRLDLRGGRLDITTPSGTEHLAQLLRRRHPDVIAYLRDKPDEPIVHGTADDNEAGQRPHTADRTPQPPPADHVDTTDEQTPPTILDQLPFAAELLWTAMRERASANPEPRLNADRPGLIWRGSRDEVMSQLWPGLPKHERSTLGTYLERGWNMKCQSPMQARPPVWWISDTFQLPDDVDFRTPGDAAPQQLMQDNTRRHDAAAPVPGGSPSAEQPAEPGDDLAGLDLAGLQNVDPVTMVRSIVQRVLAAEQQAQQAKQRADAAEQRAQKAERRADEAEQRADAIEAARAALAREKQELAEANATLKAENDRIHHRLKQFGEDLRFLMGSPPS